MSVSLPKFFRSLANCLLMTGVLGALGVGGVFAQHPDILLPLLGILFLWLCYLAPLLIWLAIALLCLSPFILLGLLVWLVRYVKRRRAERAARERLAAWNQPFPLPPAAPQPERIPLLQRRFH